MSMESRIEVSEALKKAREYEQKNITEEVNRQKPSFHVCAPIGWINDPNGFSVYKGEYHLFYQYYPYAKAWGPMHWGHSVSKDLVSWKDLPAALAPDKDYDHAGCFSGSALEYQGQHVLLYTGVEEKETENGKQIRQTQCLAIGDGVDYQKTEDNPVIYPDGLPQGSSLEDFRDPKIWQEGDIFYAVMGSRSNDGSGQIPVYTSRDLRNWSLVSILDKCENQYGKMWECPDFFRLDGKWVLLTSPQDMLPKGFEYHNGNGTLCLIGEYDEETGTFTEQHDQAIDYGIDFYATQTILTPDGRRVMIGWMQNWDACNLRSPEDKWFGQMSLPRELFIKEGRLCQRPVRELDELRMNKVEHRDVTFSDVISLDGVKGRKVDIELTLRPGDGEKLYQKFALRFAQNDQYQTAISFRPHESVLKVDRKFSGSRRAIIHQRRSLVNSKNGELKLRVILDRFSVEVFVNDGEQVMTATMYTDQSADGISFFADGVVTMDVVKYDLMSEE